MIQLVVLEDQTNFRMGVKYAFEGNPDIHVADDKCKDAAFFGILDRTPADVVLLGVNKPDDPDYVTIVRQIRCDFPAVKILIVADAGTDRVVKSLMKTGINGCIEKGQASRDELEKAIRQVAAGGEYICNQLKIEN